MPDEFADALDRLDITFEDAPDRESLRERLREILVGGATDFMVDIAMNKFRDQRQLATAGGFQVTRFERQGRSVQVLRDARGRFVAQTDFLARPEGQRTIVRGAGAILDALRRLTT